MTAAMTQALAASRSWSFAPARGTPRPRRAAYAGRAGFALRGAPPHGKIALGKLAQARNVRGGNHRLRGNFDDACAWCANWAKSRAWKWSTRSIRPHRGPKKPPR